MSFITNVISAQQDFIVERGTGFGYYLRCKSEVLTEEWSIDIDGVKYLDWRKFSNIDMAIVDKYGKKVLSFSLGAGFTIYAPDPSRLFFEKQADVKNLTPGIYYQDLKLTVTPQAVCRPLAGRYIVVNAITK